MLEILDKIITVYIAAGLLYFVVKNRKKGRNILRYIFWPVFMIEKILKKVFKEEEEEIKEGEEK